LSQFGRFSLNTTLYYSLSLYYLSHSRESPREDEEGMKMKNKNKMRITGAFLIAVMSLSIMLVLADTIASAKADKSYMTSENIVVRERLHDKIVERERLHSKYWEDESVLGRGSQYQYRPGAGGFGDIGAPENLPF
jgi:hypothetical protein